EQAKTLTEDQTARLAQLWLLQADADGADPDDRAQSASLSETFAGTWQLNATLTPEGGLTLNTVLQRIIDQLRDSYGDDLTAPPIPQLRAEGLAEMARLASAARGDSEAGRPLFVVPVDLSDLEAQRPAPTDTGHPVSGQTLRRWLCDADVTVVY